MSLLIPTTEDVRVGRDLAKRRLISIDRGLQRWNSMFRSAVVSDDGRTVAARVDVPPSLSGRDIDMDNEQNRDWNLRTLTMMAMAGFVALESAPQMRVVPDGTRHEYVELRVLVGDHLSTDAWERSVEPYRRRSAVSSINSSTVPRCPPVKALRRGIACRAIPAGRGRPPPSAPSAARTNMQRLPHCRLKGRPVRPSSDLTDAPHPWPPLPAVGSDALSLDHCRRLVVLYEGSFPHGGSGRRRHAAFARTGPVRV